MKTKQKINRAQKINSLSGFVHLVYFVPKTGLPYLAGITRHRYLAEDIVNGRAGGSVYYGAKISIQSYKANFPVWIWEKNGRFSIKTEKRAEKLKSGNIYYVEGDWFPPIRGIDYMGTLDHGHLGKEKEVETDFGEFDYSEGSVDSFDNSFA